MNFQFQHLKPLIQKEFDEILKNYPTNMDNIRNSIPVGGDPYVRKEAILNAAAEYCPVHLFPHYPFAFEIDVGEPRHVCYAGVGNECNSRSGVIFTELRELGRMMGANNIGSFNDYTDYLHNTLNHEMLLKHGFRGVYEACERLNATEEDGAKHKFRQHLMFSCKCLEKIGLRLRALAAEMLPHAEDEDARHNLSRIVHSANTPWEPAQTMFDALNSILCTSLFITGLDGVEMNCHGRLDLLLYPFYCRDIANGIITEEEAYFLIQCFLHRTDMHCSFNDQRKTYDNGVSVIIGGTIADGSAVYNSITDLVLRAYTENKLINPKLNARACATSPAEYIEKLAALMQTGNNNLIIENDDYIIPMFRRMGLSQEDSCTYVGNGCQEVICCNQVHSRAFTYLNMPKILLDTIMYTPKTLPADLRKLYCYGSFETDTFDAVKSSFMSNLRSVLQNIAETFALYEAQHHSINPETLLSAFTADCVTNGRSISEGGARYYNKTFSLVGFGTLCDSLLSLRTAFDEGYKDELLKATAQNFEGYEELHHRLTTSTCRFGHCAEADAFAQALANELAEVSRGIKNAQGIEWRTSLFTNYLFAYFGNSIQATPDGRYAKTPLSRQMNMATLPDLTTAALSMSRLTVADFNDVGVFDFTLPLVLHNSEKVTLTLADFLRTCIQLKLPVIQPNVTNVQALIEERDKKGTHPDIVVRVCGYSAPFGQLDISMQNEIISRSLS